MNSTVALSQIILRLTKITGVDTATARRFVRAFFGTIEEALIHGESVTVKGIGTFRLVEGLDSDRPSKIAFVPDEDLAAQINAPFAMFEAVELADGVEFPEEPEEEETTQTPEPEPAVEPTPEPEPESETAPEPESEPEPEPEIEEEILEEEPLVEEPVVEEPVVEESPVEEPVIDEYEPKRSYLPWIIGGAIIVLGAVGGYLAAIYDPDEKPVEAVAEEIEPAPADTTMIIEDLSVDDITLAQSAAPSNEPVEEQTPGQHTAPEPVYDTVSATNYLATMARKYYGKSGYWVFIYQANADKLHNPNRISPGTRVLIPDKSSFAEDTEEATTRKAEMIRRELNEKYGN